MLPEIIFEFASAFCIGFDKSAFLFQGKDLMKTFWLLGKEGFQFRIEKEVCAYIPKKKQKAKVAAVFEFEGESGTPRSNASIVENGTSH